MSTTMKPPRFSLAHLGASIVLLTICASSTASPLQLRTFVSSASLWFCSPDRITTWCSDTRAARVVRLTDSVDVDSIDDVSESDGSLWTLARSGIYAIDMGTGTITRIPASARYPSSAKCAADQDYFWVAGSATLDRFDKLSREWQSFVLPDQVKGSVAVGLYSDGSAAYLFTNAITATFSIADEKWTARPTGGWELSASSRMFIDKNGPVFVDSLRACRYIIAAQSWDVVRAPSPLLDVLPQDTALYMLTGDNVLQYDTRGGVLKKLDIPDARGALRLARMSGSLVLAAPRSFVVYADSTRTSENLEMPALTDAPETILSLVALGTTLVAAYPRSFASFDPSARV